MTESFKKTMIQTAGELGVSLTEKMAEQLFFYYEQLTEKNKVMNLTGITEEQDVVIKHFADSLSIARVINLKNMVLNKDPVKLIDVGTGAVFPGLVLKIAFPKLDVTLFDSLNKRLKFLNEVIESLKLEGVDTVHGRAEDFGHNELYREKYDIAVSRAVANMSTLSEYCLPFLKRNGIFVAYKSAEADEEIKSAEGALKRLGGVIEGKDKFMLPGTDIERCLVIVKKDKVTPKKYPRRAGLPSSDPLK